MSSVSYCFSKILIDIILFGVQFLFGGNTNKWWMCMYRFLYFYFNDILFTCQVCLDTALLLFHRIHVNIQILFRAGSSNWQWFTGTGTSPNWSMYWLLSLYFHKKTRQHIHNEHTPSKNHILFQYSRDALSTNYNIMYCIRNILLDTCRSYQNSTYK